MTDHHRRCLGQKLSKNCLEDHCSRDPVQVQSKGIRGVRCGLQSRASEKIIGNKRCKQRLPLVYFRPRLVGQRRRAGVPTGGVLVCWDMKSHKNSEIHIDVSHSRQPLVKGERLVRYEVNTVMPALCRHGGHKVATLRTCDRSACFSAGKRSAALRASAPGQARPVQKSIASQRDLFTQRVRCSWRSAMPGQHA